MLISWSAYWWDDSLKIQEFFFLCLDLNALLVASVNYVHIYVHTKIVVAGENILEILE